jgi:hypothetical protein
MVSKLARTPDFGVIRQFAMDTVEVAKRWLLSKREEPFVFPAATQITDPATPMA